MTLSSIYYLRLYYISNYINYKKVVLSIFLKKGENIGSIFRKCEIAELDETQLRTAPSLEQPD